MIGWPEYVVRVTHTPTGIEASANEGRSLFTLRDHAVALLHAKLYTASYGPMPVVRSYEIQDGLDTTEELNTGSRVGDRLPCLSA